VKPYRLGELNQRVTFQSRAETRTASGGAQKSLVDVDTVWAKVEARRGRERKEAERPDATSDYLVVIRYRDDIDPRWVISWNGRIMNITFVRDEGAQEHFLEIEASAGVAY
jgi:SPP1 family predicted phage head-tail adaptor